MVIKFGGMIVKVLGDRPLELISFELTSIECTEYNFMCLGFC